MNSRFVFVVFGYNLGRYDTISIFDKEDDAIKNVEDLNNVFSDINFDYRAIDLYFFLDKVLMEVV